MMQTVQIRQRTRVTPVAQVTGRPADPDMELDAAPAAPAEGAPDYVVGYGRPPRGRPFAPGRSGNPYGRPKGSKNSATLLSDALDERVMVREGGREKMISKRDVGLRRLANKFAEGDSKAQALCLRLIDLVGHTDARGDAEAPTPEGEALSYGGDDVLAEIRELLRRQIAAELGTPQ